MKRFLFLVIATMLITAPAMAEERSQGLNIQRTTPSAVPQGGFGGVPQQTAPQNSVTQSAGEQQQKMTELQRKAYWRKECKRIAYSGANQFFPACWNGQCPPTSSFKKKWDDKFNMIQSQCLKQHNAE